MQILRIFLAATFCTMAFLACEKSPSGQKPADTKYCKVDDNFKQEYQRDATYLLYRNIRKDSAQHPDFQQPIFNRQIIEKYLGELNAINQMHSPYSDTVFKHLPVKVRPFYSARVFSLSLDPQSPEIQKVIDHLPTGNPTYDSIAQTFGIEVTYHSPALNWTNFETDTLYNLFPVVQRLKNLPFVLNVEVSGFIGDGPNIIRHKLPNGVRYTFSMGWGDCPAGCIYRRSWTFEVNEKCEAKFIKVDGPVLPDYLLR